MRENLEILASRDCDQRDATRFGGADGERSWRRYRNENGSAEDGRLLDRNAAGQKHHTGAAVDLAASKGSHELVECVVTADIFAHCNEPFVGLAERSRVHGTGREMKRLCGIKCLYARRNILRVNVHSAADWG